MLDHDPLVVGDIGGRLRPEIRGLRGHRAGLGRPIGHVAGANRERNGPKGIIDFNGMIVGTRKMGQRV
jgi:hypothetical protein